MEFRISDTFTDSLTKLTGGEQRAVKTTAFDLQINPANPGLQFHGLAKGRDRNFSSVRVSREIRLIVHRTDSSLLLCYVGHHDEAYMWAERRKLETHPRTGAAQLVEIRQTTREVNKPTYAVEEPSRPSQRTLFDHITDDELLGYGVPEEWLSVVREASENSVLEISEHLPAEAAEALLEIAVGSTPHALDSVPDISDPFEHPDALRRFRTVDNVEELELALDYPWEKWTVFLHPSQRDLVERRFNGPARVHGSAGTGKTIVAIHRAASLARENPEARVLLTTFSDTLANALRLKLRRLIGNEPRLAERIEVRSVNAITRRLYELHFGAFDIASKETIQQSLIDAANDVEDAARFTPNFLITEWEQVVDAWQLYTWESYRDVTRLGRRTRLTESRRATLWTIFERVRSDITSTGQITEADLYHRVANRLHEVERTPFDLVVVDEAQDVAVPQLRLLAELGSGSPDGLFFAGDLGQRIFQQPFSWLSLGVDIRGRSRQLRVNYRTSHQIRAQADRLLEPETADVDGNTEVRRGTVSVFNGPPPMIYDYESVDDEIQGVAKWLLARRDDGLAANELAVFVRSDDEIERAKSALDAADIPYKVLNDDLETTSGFASICTMHLAKGLEFRAVAVMACDDEVIPSQERIETIVDEMDLEDVYNTERHLLYVACTRARDHLLVTSVEPASEFVADMEG